MENEDEHTAAAQSFYKEALQTLINNKFPFLIGGTYALRHFTGIYRDTKDLDIFCKANEFQRILKCFLEEGYKVEITDVRWLAKVFKGPHFIDIIFNTVNNLCPVDDSWFEHAIEGELFDTPVYYIAPEDLVWCKVYIQNRERFDGADINHLILKYGNNMDWNLVLKRLDQHWHLLLSQIINYQFVYPSERHLIPKWLFNELLERASEQYDLPAPVENVCLGPIIDQTQYSVDIKDWDYKALTIKTV